MSWLEVKNIYKSFGKTEVLKGIDFSLEKGEVLALIGSSGSGKTTLLRCLNFLETPDEGTITVKDEVLFDATLHEKFSDEQVRQNRLHFGLVFQNFNLFPQYTALRNVTLAMDMQAEMDLKARGVKMLARRQQMKQLRAENEETAKAVLNLFRERMKK
jgi:polar amino acid transport system ATP-binding protein